MEKGHYHDDSYDVDVDNVDDDFVLVMMMVLEIRNLINLSQTSAVLQCLLREARDSRKEAAIVRSVGKFISHASLDA